MANIIGTNGNDNLQGFNGPHYEIVNGVTVLRPNGNDTIQGLGGNDTINGLGGDDLIFGNEGNDRLFGGDGEDTINGGSGNDLISGGLGVDSLDGAAGNDTVSYTYSSSGFNINLGTQLTNNNEIIRRFENVLGSQGNDTIYGNNLANDLEGEQGNDLIFGRGGNDTLEGESGNDSLYGESGRDSLLGGNGNDYLNGGSSNDTLIGGSGNDVLVGGTGADNLTNDGSGNDIFRYFSVSESTPSSRDTVGLDRGFDRIDLSAIDADLSTPGNQGFDFIGTTTFPNSIGGSGEVRYDATRNVIQVELQGDGDNLVDMEISSSVNFDFLTPSDFIL